jgi:hypothetical protein
MPTKGPNSHRFVYLSSKARPELRQRLFELEKQCQRVDCPHCKGTHHPNDEVFHLRPGKASVQDSVRLCKGAYREASNWEGHAIVQQTRSPQDYKIQLSNETVQGNEKIKASMVWNVKCAPGHWIKGRETLPPKYTPKKKVPGVG